LKTNYIIREFKSGDFTKIIPLWLSLDLGNPERGDNQQIIENTINSGGKLFVLELVDDSEIIGASWITNDQRRLYLHHFGIKKEYQGKGYAKLLMDKTMKFAQETGLQIKLEVHKSNLTAVELYKKYNFKYLGDYQVYIVRDYETKSS